MKKLFTLLTAMVLSAVAFAQADGTFVFTDLQGNVVTDGSVVTVTEINEAGQMVVPLKVKNVSGEKAAVSMYENIDQKPNGSWQTCAFGNCMMLPATGYSSKNIMEADFEGSIETEWIPDEGGSNATWEATLQIHVFNIVKQTVFGVTTEKAGDMVIGYGPTITVRFEAGGSQQQTSEQWWGYYDENNYRTALGTQKAETVNQAIFIAPDNSIVAGKTIKGVRFFLRSIDNIKDLKVWVSSALPATADRADYVQTLDLKTLQGGDQNNSYVGLPNEVMFSEPYTMPEGKGVYVGYSYTVTSVTQESGQFPIVLSYEDAVENSCYLFTPTTGKWQALYDYGPLALKVLFEGTFMTNAASTANLSETIIALGSSVTATLTLTNNGTAGISDIDYTITADGATGAEQHLTLAKPCTTFGGTTYATITLDADAQAGSKEKVITITKVNGQPNEDANNKANVLVTTVSKIVPRGIAVEEFTGTTCGWCPRGIVGMEKMRKEFGDQFVGIAIHRYATSTASDAMYISSYNHVSFGGAPSCRINRGPVIDPYYGSGYDVLDDFRAEAAIPAKAALSVEGQWDSTEKKVTATASIENLVDGADYTIEYVLIADSLTGTTAAWRQYNYYNKAYGNYTSANQLPADLGFLVNIGEVYNNSYVAYYPIFNDVAIAVAKSTQTTAPGKLAPETPTTNTYTLTMPTNSTLLKAIDKKKVWVAALLIDAKTGLIVNAAKYCMANDQTAIRTAEQTAATTTEARYSLDGRRIATAQKGLNIVRMNDGSVRKIMVK